MRDELEVTLDRLTGGLEVTLDRLAGGWWIYQLRRGQRYATDDVVTAWCGARARPEARKVLDLGSGVGSVGLIVLQMLRDPAACLVGVEVQPISHALARRTVDYNGLTGRVEMRLGDLRAPDVLAKDERFDLIVANPPFLPAGTGWISSNPQRGAARFELHGDVGDYCRVAAAHLSAGGRFCFCHSASDPRPGPAIRAAGLQLLSSRQVIFRRGRPPRLALYVCGHPEGAAPAPPRQEPPLVVRDESGRRTAEYEQLLRQVRILA